MSIEGGIANLQTKVLALTGMDIAGRTVKMQAAPEQPTEAANQFPFAVAYEREAETVFAASEYAQDAGLIYCEIHVARVMLGAAIVLAMSFRDPFLKLLIADPTLGRNVSPITRVKRTFGALTWGKVDTIGYRFEIAVPSALTATDVS